MEYTHIYMCVRACVCVGGEQARNILPLKREENISKLVQT